MRYLPLGVDVRGRRCLVAGGGAIGVRKARTLLRAGATVVLVSPEATEEVVRMAESGRITWLRERYQAEHLHGVLLAVAATDDEGTNSLLVADAAERGVLVCDASDAERSQVIFGALHETDGLIVAVFSDGKDPSRSREARDRIAVLLREGEEPRKPC